MRPSRPIFFLQSSCIRVDLLSYERKTTDKREQYDWGTEKNFDGFQAFEGLFLLKIKSTKISHFGGRTGQGVVVVVVVVRGLFGRSLCMIHLIQSIKI